MSKTDKYKSSILDDLLNEITPEEQEKTDKRMQLAARIDDAIKAKGWNRQDFAKALDKYPSEISKWLSGTHNFNSDTLFDIESVLGIKLVNTTDTTKEEVVKYKATAVTEVKNNVGNNYAIAYLGDSFTNLMYANSIVRTQTANKKSFEYKA